MKFEIKKEDPSDEETHFSIESTKKSVIRTKRMGYSKDVVENATKYLVRESNEVQCKLCSYSCPSLRIYLAEKHVIYNHISCDICKEPFSSTYSEHLHATHNIAMPDQPDIRVKGNSPLDPFKSDDNSPVCVDCDTTFKDVFSLKKHIIKDHLKAKINACPKCGKEFAITRSFNKHMETFKDMDCRQKDSRVNDVKKQAVCVRQARRRCEP